jgi:translation initiation factor 2 alpha subunit (eIF-2alpha)
MADTKKLPDTARRRPPAAGKGRPKGATNKLTKSIKEAIEAAFQGVGGPEYLMRQAEENPQAFMTLLGKIIPNQIQADLTNSDGSFKPAVIQIVAAQPKK